MNNLLSFVRTAVSGDSNRYVDGNFDLDLTYITDNVIAMGYPASGIEGAYRNPIDQVSQFFELNHRAHYMIWNLSQRQYEYALFNYQVVDFGFPEYHSPPLDLLFEICYSMKSWMSLDDENIAAVHCMNGDGRTGLVVACYLVYSGKFETGHEALDYFANKRASKGYGDVNVPSQKRYVQYFSDVHRGVVKVTRRPLRLKRVIINTIPRFDPDGRCRPYLKIFREENRSCVYKSPPKQCKFYLPTDGSMSFHLDALLEGDVLMQFFHVGSDKKATLMFRFAFHTSFSDSVLRLTKKQLDGAVGDERLADDFFMDLIFDEVPLEVVLAEEAAARKEKDALEMEKRKMSRTSPVIAKHRLNGGELAVEASCRQVNETAKSSDGDGNSKAGVKKEPTGNVTANANNASGDEQTSKGVDANNDDMNNNSNDNINNNNNDINDNNDNNDNDNKGSDLPSPVKVDVTGKSSTKEEWQNDIDEILNSSPSSPTVPTTTHQQISKPEDETAVTAKTEPSGSRYDNRLTSFDQFMEDLDIDDVDVSPADLDQVDLDEDLMDLLTMQEDEYLGQ